MFTSFIYEQLLHPAFPVKSFKFEKKFRILGVLAKKKLKSSDPNIFATWWYKPLIFQTQVILSLSINSLKYLRSTTLGYKDIEIRKSESDVCHFGLAVWEAIASKHIYKYIYLYVYCKERFKKNKNDFFLESVFGKVLYLWSIISSISLL